MLGITELKLGTNVSIDGTPYTVVWNQFSKTGRQGGVMKTKLKNLINGTVMEQSFQGSEKVEPAEIGYRRAQFLYKNGTEYAFMENDTYEQHEFSAETLGEEKASFLVDGMDVDLMFWDGKVINIKLPPTVTLVVKETEPGVKGDTAGTANKSAIMATGLEVKVPLFIEAGESLVINTETGEYRERAK